MLYVFLFSYSVLFTSPPSTAARKHRVSTVQFIQDNNDVAAPHKKPTRRAKPTPPQQQNNVTPYATTHYGTHYHPINWQANLTLQDKMCDCVEHLCCYHDCLGLRICGACLIASFVAIDGILPMLNQPPEQNMQ